MEWRVEGSPVAIVSENAEKKRDLLFRKSKTKDGKFGRKKKSELSWRNYVRSFFNQQRKDWMEKVEEQEKEVVEKREEKEEEEE